jgi:hypothetical protein
MLDGRFDCTHEQELLASIYCTIAKLGDGQAPHICACKILIAKDQFDMVGLMFLLIGLKESAYVERGSFAAYLSNYDLHTIAKSKDLSNSLRNGNLEVG